MGLFNFEGREQREVKRLVLMLNREKRPITVEVEQFNMRFASIVALRRETIVIPRPGKLKSILKEGHILRVYDPKDRSWTLRLEIEQPSLMLSNGVGVCVCKFPTAFAQGDVRGTPRYSTRHVKMLSVVVSDDNERYRVLDLSERGCKVFIHRGDPEDVLPLGMTLHRATLVLGAMRIPLDEIVARSHHEHTAGCEFIVSKDEKMQRMFKRILDKLDFDQREGLRTRVSV